MAWASQSSSTLIRAGLSLPLTKSPRAGILPKVADAVGVGARVIAQLLGWLQQQLAPLRPLAARQ